MIRAGDHETGRHGRVNLTGKLSRIVGAHGIRFKRPPIQGIRQCLRIRYMRKLRQTLFQNAANQAESNMTELAWLAGHQFQSIARREFDWVVPFDKEVSLTITCLWRLLENGHIRFTSEDDGHQFGLPAPVDAAAEVNQRLAKAFVKSVELRDAVLDLAIHFSTGHVLEIIPTSSGYEAWTVSRRSQQFIAVGGGDLAVFGD